MGSVNGCVILRPFYHSVNLCLGVISEISCKNSPPRMVGRGQKKFEGRPFPSQQFIQVPYFRCLPIYCCLYGSPSFTGVTHFRFSVPVRVTPTPWIPSCQCPGDAALQRFKPWFRGCCSGRCAQLLSRLEGL